MLNPQPEKKSTGANDSWLRRQLNWAHGLAINSPSSPGFACDITFVFVHWWLVGVNQRTGLELDRRQRCLPNVRHVGRRPLSSGVAQYYWSFCRELDSLMQWSTQLSAPTKFIMDGIASSRPILSDIPECCLYPEWIKIFIWQSEKEPTPTLILSQPPTFG